MNASLPPEVPATPSARLPALDALRASALLLGVFLHATLAYLPYEGLNWAIQDKSTHPLLGVATFLLHSFRLSLFFLLAGFFGRVLRNSKGTWAYAVNRLKRLALPFVLGWLLVFPGLSFSWIWGGMKGDPALLGAAAKAALLETLHQLSRVLNGSFVRDFPLTHLWFLYVLLLLCLSFLLVRALLERLLKHRSDWKCAVDRVFVRLFVSPWRLPLLLALSLPFLFGMQRWGIDTPDKSFRLHLPLFGLYGMAFSLGWLLHRNSELLEVLKKKTSGHLLVAGLCCVPALVLTGIGTRASANPGALLRLAHHVLYAGMLWSIVLASLGLFLRHFQRPNHVWRYLSESSYWVYLSHLPLVTTLQVALSRSDWSCWGKVVLCTLLPTALCLGSYHLFVRSTPLGLLLNGKRHPFRRV